MKKQFSNPLHDGPQTLCGLIILLACVIAHHYGGWPATFCVIVGVLAEAAWVTVMEDRAKAQEGKQSEEG
jgi:hypothetical protein